MYFNFTSYIKFFQNFNPIFAKLIYTQGTAL